MHKMKTNSEHKKEWKKSRWKKVSRWKEKQRMRNKTNCDHSKGDKVTIRKANLLMLIHERNSLIMSTKISEISSKMSDANKVEKIEIERMYGCGVCRKGGHLWMGRNAQVLHTHFNQHHRGHEGEFNMMVHQYYEEDKVKIREWLSTKKNTGTKPKVTAKTPSGKGKKPMKEGKDIDEIAMEMLKKKGEATEDTLSVSASGLTPDTSQESQVSQMSSQAFSPIAASTRNASSIETTITISSDSSTASSDASVKIINGVEHNVIGTGRGKKHGLEKIAEDSDDDDDSKKQKLCEEEISKFSHDELNRGLKKAILQDKADKAKRAAMYGGELGDEDEEEAEVSNDGSDGTKMNDSLSGLMNDTLDNFCNDYLADKEVINVETAANDTLMSEGRETREQNELFTEMQGQLKGKQEEVEGIRIQLQEKEYQVSEMKSSAKRKDLMIEQLNEKLKKHEETAAMLERLCGAQEGQGNIVKRMCEELVLRKGEITKLKEDLHEETKEKNKLRTMYDNANSHITLLTGANKQAEAEVKEIRRNMICPQIKEGGWCTLPENQCDYKHPPPRSEQGCKWNYPKHPGTKPRRCKKKDCEFKHDPNLQKENKNEEENKDQDENDVHMMEEEDRKELEKEEADKKKRIEERRKKRANRKLNKVAGKVGGAGNVSNNATNPKPVQKNPQLNRQQPQPQLQPQPQPQPQPNNFQAQFENFQGRFNHPPPQLPQIQQIPQIPHQIPPPQLPVIQQQPQVQVPQAPHGYVQPQQALQQHIPVLPVLQPRYAQVANQEPVSIQNLPQPVPIVAQPQAIQNQAQREPFNVGQLDNVVNDSANQGNPGFEINWANAPPPFPQREGRVSVQHPPSQSNRSNNHGRGEQGQLQAIPNFNSQRIQIRQEIEKEKDMYQRQKEEEERLRIQNEMIRERQNQFLLRQQMNQIQTIQNTAVQYLPNQGQAQQQATSMGQQQQHHQQGGRYM